MEIHPIRNDDDHAAAIREIQRFWGAAAGTEEGDEARHSRDALKNAGQALASIDVSDPIDLLNYAIDELRTFAGRTRRSARLPVAGIRDCSIAGALWRSI
jgi:antitoxin component HigA of HigAB toxin-antitoxin module